MMLLTPSRFTILVFLLAVAILPACSSSETVKAPPSSFYRLAPVPPPNPVAEVKQQPIDPMIEMWRPGYWSYNGKSFSWVPGRLMGKPYPTASWVPDSWYKFTYGWGFIPGHWM